MIEYERQKQGPHNSKIASYNSQLERSTGLSCVARFAAPHNLLFRGFSFFYLLLQPQHCKMAHFSSSLSLGDVVKSREVVGARLQVSTEPGTPNDFGIFNKHEGNPTAAYTVQEREGYKKWRGRWNETIVWDRDSYAPPPEVLRCVHVTEIPFAAATHSARHGWIFIDRLQKIDLSSVCLDSAPSEKDKVVKREVKARQRRIEEQRKQIERDMQTKEVEVERLTQRVNAMRLQLQGLERQRDEMAEAVWRERNDRGVALQREEQACMEIVFQHHHIDFS